MDAVRFGRALGFGARQAAKTVIRAVDAARAENPSPSVQSQSQSASTVTAPRPFASSAPVNRPAAAHASSREPAVASNRTVPVATQARGIQEGISRFKTSAVEPVVRLSGVLWLEVTGVFFALFALAAANGVWRLRADLRPALTHPAAHASILGAVAIFALFAYFSISSFVRAHRRQHRRG